MNISDVRIYAAKADSLTHKLLIWMTALPEPLATVLVIVILVLAGYAGHVL